VRIFERLDKVDFANVFQQMTGTMESIRQIASSPELKTAISNSEKTRQILAQTLGTARQTMDTLDTQIRPLSSSLQKTSLSTDAAAKQATLTLGAVQTTIEPNSPVNYQVVQTLQDVSAAARSIKELADYLQRNPSAIVRGRDLSQDMR
jgi:paraquat-inducible protein B